MFGYLMPDKPEMKVREYDSYRAYYCGVCHALKKRYGLPCTALLTYDAALLALAGCAAGKNATVRKGRCAVNPLRKVNIAEGSAIDYAADTNLLLAALKSRDNWQDEHNIIGGAGSLLLSGAATQARKRLGAAAQEFEQSLGELTILENDNCADIDPPCMAFGKALEALCAGLSDDEKNQAVLRAIGFNIGRWLYLIDAYDDLDKDEQKKSYNVLINRFGSAKAARESEGKERVEFNLLYSLVEAEKALALLPQGEHRNLAQYVLCGGAAQQTQKVLRKSETQTEEAK